MSDPNHTESKTLQGTSSDISAAERSTKVPLRRKILISILLICISGILALSAAEVILRLIHIPGIGYHTFYYDDLTGGNFYPNTTKIFQSARGDVVKRKVNAWGFLDVQHEKERPFGTFRIGFFGDSYTEAEQVPIEDTFFRLIEDDLNKRLTAGAVLLAGRDEPARRAETIAFGVSGRSTLQSYLECSRRMSSLDLDYVVYVFCENDVSDQIRELHRVPGIPYAYLEGDSFAVDDSFRERFRYKTSFPHRTVQYVKAHSLVLSALESRIKLLIRYGPKTKVTSDDMQMEAALVESFEHGKGTGPSAWKSDSLLSYGKILLTRVMDAWSSEVTAQNRKFIVMYVPKERHMDKPIEDQDSWAMWLHDYCNGRGITLVDPSSVLVERRDQGEEVFYDHFTSAGHRAVADAFLELFE